jgi:hypothetical protein
VVAVEAAAEVMAPSQIETPRGAEAEGRRQRGAGSCRGWRLDEEAERQRRAEERRWNGSASRGAEQAAWRRRGARLASLACRDRRGDAPGLERWRRASPWKTRGSGQVSTRAEGGDSGSQTGPKNSTSFIADLTCPAPKDASITPITC